MTCNTFPLKARWAAQEIINGQTSCPVVRIQCSLIYRTVTDRLQNTPHSCCWASKEHSCISRNRAYSYCICSAGCLQRAAVNKGCVESLWRHPSRRDVTTRACAVHQQLSCSPRGHNKKSRSIWGQTVNHSQQSLCTSQPKSSWNCAPQIKSL